MAKAKEESEKTMVCMLIVFCFWAHCLWGAALPERPAGAVKQSRFGAIGKEIREAEILPNALANLTAEYADDFLPLVVQKKFIVREPVHCMEMIGQRCLLAAVGTKIFALDLKTGARKDIASRQQTPIMAIAHKSNFDVVTGDKFGNVCLLNIKTGERYRHWRYPEVHPVQALAFLGQNTFVSVDNNKLWFHWLGKQIVCEENIHSLMPFGNHLVTTGLGDGSIHIIDAKEKRVIQTLHGHTSAVVSLARLADDTIVSAAENGDVHISDMQGNIHKKMKLCSKIRLITLEDEVISVNASDGDLHRFKKSTEFSDPVHVFFGRSLLISKVAVPAAGNFFVGVALGGAKADDTISVVRRVGDEVPTEEIDGEFEKWVEEWPKPKKKVKKPWYVCW